MIVYQALSTYQILECIEHRKIYHAKESAVLILGTYIVEKFPDYNQLSKDGFFEDIYLFEFGSVEADEKKVLETMDRRVKETFPFKFKDVEKIYIAGIHTYLSVYLIEQGIPFSMFEDGSGALSRPWVLADITQKSDLKRYKIVQKYGLYEHSSNLIEEKWCNIKTQLPDFKDGKVKNFDVVDAFEELSKKEREKLLSFFHIEKKINVPKDGVLVLTQQFANLEQLSFEEHIRIYQYLLDFYLNTDNENLIFKLHPDDIMYYDKLFPGIHSVREMFPSELLPYVFEQIPKKVVTITSTGIHLIQDKFQESLVFNEQYEKSFVCDPIYYVLVKLLEEMGELSACCRGMNKPQLQNMLDCCSKTSSLKLCEEGTQKICVLIVDDFDTTAIDEKVYHDQYETIIYLNSLRKYQIYSEEEKESFEKLIPIEISLKPYMETENNLEEEHTLIWIKTENEGWKEKMNTFKLEKDLKNTGAKLSVKTFTGDELEIMRLKGLLEATERRLSDYIEREKAQSEGKNTKCIQ